MLSFNIIYQGKRYRSLGKKLCIKIAYKGMPFGPAAAIVVANTAVRRPAHVLNNCRHGRTSGFAECLEE